MISVEKAFQKIVNTAKPLPTERLAIAEASGRVLAGAIKARRSQPGCDMSAMDGYAVRSADLKKGGSEAKLTLIGESAAGAPYSGTLKTGETVRIFTGAAVPDGADQVVIQENTGPTDTGIFTDDAPETGKNIRYAGYDFADGQTLLDAGVFISPKSIGLIASAGHSHAMVYRAPKIALLSTGDELASPDQKKFKPHQTVNSTIPQLESMIADTGATSVNLGQAGDNLKSLTDAIKKGADADILVTIGGASVGDKDLMQQALAREGMELNFWKVAMKPGKPLIFGKIDNQYVLGLPGNPVSAFVCSLMFLRPLIDQLMGRPAPQPTGVPLPVATNLPANGPRQDYMRARLIGNPGERHVDPAVSQDSGHLSVLALTDGLIVRPPHAEAVEAGTTVPFIPF